METQSRYPYLRAQGTTGDYAAVFNKVALACLVVWDHVSLAKESLHRFKKDDMGTFVSAWP